jgi:hypothetical protein
VRIALVKNSCSPCSHAALQAVPYTFGFIWI